EGDTVGGDMDATDVDGLTDGTYFTVTAAATNGTAAIDPETGVWTFTPSDANWFGSDSFTVTITDDLGGTTEQVVNVTLANVDDAAVITGDVTFIGNEGDTVGGDMDATDVDGLTDGTYFTVTAAAANGTAAIDPETGVWTFTPSDSNWQGTDSFTVTVTDDLGGTTEQVVSITLSNADDLAVITGDVAFNGNEGDVVGGDMDASDVGGLTDGNYFTVTAAATSGTATIDPETGVWSFIPFDPDWFGTDSFTVTVTDDLGGTTEQVVGITLTNVDDAAVITGDISAGGNEGDTLRGDIDARDSDGLNDGSIFTVVAPASNGTAIIDPGSGAWTYVPDDPDWFGDDQFTVAITDDQGGTANQVVSITLAAAGDAPILGGMISGTITEDENVIDGQLVLQGVATVSDSDPGESVMRSNVAIGSYGILTNDTDGAWVYVADNASEMIQSLDEGETLLDTLVVTTADGTTAEVQITIRGSEDLAEVSGDDAGSVAVQQVFSASGSLSITDVDRADNPLFEDVAPVISDNGYGRFEMQSGVWTYTLDTFSPALQLLQPGQTVEDSIEFTASDGTKSKVVVTIIGTSEKLGFASAQTPGVTQDNRPSLTDIVTVAATGDDAASVVAAQTATPDKDTRAAEPNPASEDGLDAFVSQAPEVPALDNASQSSNNTILVPLDALARRSGAAGVPAAFVAPSEALLREIMLTEFDVGPLATEDTAPLTLVEQLAQQEALREAMAIVREDTRSYNESERTTEHAIDISLRVGGAVLSTGSLAWLLRGAGLFASALTSIPAWKGFDPLPVLTRKKRDDIEDAEDDVAHADGDSEDAVGRVLDNIGSNSTQASPSPDNRNMT
ncbi:MAG: VCBS domain-containing protein, partial [Gammaproteobacteria bacterium]